MIDSQRDMIMAHNPEIADLIDRHISIEKELKAIKADAIKNSAIDTNGNIHIKGEADTSDD